MRVARLIELLSRFNGDAEIRCWDRVGRLAILSVYAQGAPNNPTLPTPRVDYVEIDLEPRD